MWQVRDTITCGASALVHVEKVTTSSFAEAYNICRQMEYTWVAP